jgi:hypothetical protein
MSKTRDELVNRIAIDLDLVGAGQDAEAEDFADIDSRLDTHIATLNAREIVNVSDLDKFKTSFSSRSSNGSFSSSATATASPGGPGRGRACRGHA